MQHLGCRGKVAVVTGASRGIGQAIARRLAADGALVAAVSRTVAEGTGRFAGSLEQTFDLVRRDGGTAVSVAADLTTDDGLERVIRTAEREFGRAPQIIVNNAAARRHFELTFPVMTREAFVEAIDVNVWAPWKLAMDAVPGMRRAGGGWIVNISSRGAAPIAGPPFRPTRVGAQSLYGTTKAAMDRLTTAAAMELYADGIAVNSVAPTRPILTENARVEAGVDESRVHEPLETMAEAVLALCECDPRTVTGRVAYSLPLLVELGRPVRTLDGRNLIPDWQPDQIDPSLLWPGYLVEPRPAR
jgi:NAD(P)-dependent dehydrogenase (short-subunit alcohol dehydrogenase family)